MLTYPLFVGTWEIVIICFIVLLIFGGKKIPELMSGIGKGVRSFKKGLEEVEEEVKVIDAKVSSNKKVETTAVKEEKPAEANQE